MQALLSTVDQGLQRSKGSARGGVLKRPASGGIRLSSVEANVTFFH
jgi:hypothetical protein